MKAAIFGSTGLLGTYLTAELSARKWEVHGSNSAEGGRVDATDAKAVSDFVLATKPDIVFNAIKTPLSTDQCEVRQDEALASNVTTAENIARACSSAECRMVHFSSDWVYAGKKGVLYSETSPIAPLNFYAKTKAIAESRVRSFCPDALILRVEGLFGIGAKGNDLFSRFLSAAKQGKPTEWSADQFAHPTFAGEAARMAAELAAKGQTGTFNAVGRDYVSRHQLACAFCDEFDYPQSLAVPVSSAGRKIAIPLHLNLDVTKADSKAGTRLLSEQLATLHKQVKKNSNAGGAPARGGIDG